MYQALTLTSIEAMAYAKFRPNNLETILGMIRDRPDAVHELLASNAQCKSLEDTYQDIKHRIEINHSSIESDGHLLMKKLIEVIKALRKLFSK